MVEKGDTACVSRNPQMSTARKKKHQTPVIQWLSNLNEPAVDSGKLTPPPWKPYELVGSSLERTGDTTEDRVVLNLVKRAAVHHLRFLGLLSRCVVKRSLGLMLVPLR